MSATDHAALVRRARSGDEDAWATLVDELGGLVWSVTRSYRLRREDAMDVAQTVWLRLATHLHRLDEPERVGLWLMTTTRRECLGTMRRLGREDSLPCVEGRPGAHIGTGVEDQVVEADRRAALWRCISCMDEPCRALLRALLADPPATYAEVAAGLGVAPGTVGPLRLRCLRLLRAMEIGHYDA